MSSPNQRYLIVVSEFTLLHLLWLTFRRREVYVHGVHPVVPAMRPWISRIIARLQNAGRVRQGREIAPETLHHYMFHKSWLMAGIFGQAEDWIERHYGFAALDAERWRFALPYKKSICNSLQPAFQLLMVLDAIARSSRAETVTVIGADPHLPSLYAHCFGVWPAFGFSPLRLPRHLINAAAAAGLCAVTLGWVLRRTRLNPPPGDDVFLGADFVPDPRTLNMLRDILGDVSGVRVMFRNASMYREYRDKTGELAVVPFQDGVFGIGSALSAMWHTLRDLWDMFRRHGGRHPERFFQLAKFPFVERTQEAMLAKHRFRYFWGRDDYNVEHVFRSWTMRKYGGVSLGVSHGTPQMPIFDPVQRYVDFDTYYVFSERIYREIYAPKWPANMRIKQVGAYGLRRHDLARLNDDRPRDVICYTKPHLDGIRILDEIIKLATVFPTRKFYVKLKLATLHYGGLDEFMARLNEGPPNVLYTEEDSYQLMFKARYAFGGISTLVEECLHYGMYSYFVDAYSDDVPLFYREYPQICLKTAEEMEARIRGIEDGTQPYPIETLGDFADISGGNIYDVVRADLGLPPFPGEVRLRYVA